MNLKTINLDEFREFVIKNTKSNGGLKWVGTDNYRFEICLDKNYDEQVFYDCYLNRTFKNDWRVVKVYCKPELILEIIKKCNNDVPIEETIFFYFKLYLDRYRFDNWILSDKHLDLQLNKFFSSVSKEKCWLCERI